MRTFSRSARALIPIVAFSAFLVAAPSAGAQNYGTISNGNNPYYFNNQTYSSGLYLPQVPQPNGQDEIRAADGTTCRSSMASNNAYLDMGGIGGQDQDGSFASGTVYGRIIVPLGGVPERLDCSALYNLEIERLRHELALIRSGATGGTGGGFVPSSAGAAGGKGKAWAEDGWSNKGWKAGDKGAVAKEQAADKAPAATVVPMRLQPKGAVNGGAINGGQMRAARADGLPSQSASSAPDAEILPWSGQPAQGARVLTGAPTRKAYVRQFDEVSPQTLVR